MLIHLLVCITVKHVITRNGELARPTMDRDVARDPREATIGFSAADGARRRALVTRSNVSEVPAPEVVIDQEAIYEVRPERLAEAVVDWISSGRPANASTPPAG
jgi:hypothetical protein